MNIKNIKIKYSFIVGIVLLLSAGLSACQLTSKEKKQLLHHVNAAIQEVEEQSASGDAATEDFTATNTDELLWQKLPKGVKEQKLVRKGYVSSYNATLLEPNYVAWQLAASRLKGNANRKGKKFTEDEEVPTPRADTYDYMQSGFDRGHMCPAGDNKWNDEAMTQSFLLTNICPQHPNLNRGDWSELEDACRVWAKKYGSIYVVCGPIFLNQHHKRIGDHKIVVPEAFFKVLLCLKGKPKAIGFIYRNTAGNRPKDAYVNSVDEVERITGIDFFPALPDNIEKQVEAKADLSEW